MKFCQDCRHYSVAPNRAPCDECLQFAVELPNHELSGITADFRHAQSLALELECMLLDPVRSYDSAVEALVAYKNDCDRINPMPPTFMGEPVSTRSTH